MFEHTRQTYKEKIGYSACLPRKIRSELFEIIQYLYVKPREIVLTGRYIWRAPCQFEYSNATSPFHTENLIPGLANRLEHFSF